jgi:hypothetical protein
MIKLDVFSSLQPSILTPTHLVHSITFTIINSLILQNISSAVVCTTVVTNKMS